MIRGIHGLFYSSKPDELRAFIRDKLKLPWSDVGGGWPIYDLEEGDLGVHPTDGDDALSGRHDLSFYTDDIAETVAELTGRGVEFDEAIADHGYGLVTHFTMPGGVSVQLYQPKYVKQTRSVPKPAAAPRAKARSKPKAKTKVKAKAKAAKVSRAPAAKAKAKPARRAKPKRRSA